MEVGTIIVIVVLGSVTGAVTIPFIPECFAALKSKHDDSDTERRI